MWFCAALLGAGQAVFAADLPSGILSVSLGLNKPPYVMEGGQTGLEVDIVRQALAATGLSMRTQQLPPARALMLQRAGQLDVLLSVDEGIGGKDFFSDNYLTYQNVAISLASRQLSIKRVEDLSAYSVAAFQNASLTLGERFRAVVSQHPNYNEYPQQLTQNNLLFSQRVDVVVGDRRVLHYLITQLDPTLNPATPVTVHPVFAPTPRKAVFKDAALRDRFNQGLRSIQANGVYDALLKKYANFQ